MTPEQRVKNRLKVAKWRAKNRPTNVPAKGRPTRWTYSDLVNPTKGYRRVIAHRVGELKLYAGEEILRASMMVFSRELAKSRVKLWQSMLIESGFTPRGSRYYL